MGPTMKHILAKVCVQLSQENGIITTVIKLNHSWYRVERYKFCIYLRNLNFCHFEMVEATELKLCH
jgi:hypothetical protein